jgi:DNA invertase Pin-like site-specific DNA recombinase
MSQKAVIYARFSTLEQANGMSLERQFGNGSTYVNSQGWTLADKICDEGRSAFTGANREKGAALHRFEDQARKGEHKGTILCVESLDRLTRQGVKTAMRLIWDLNECGVTIATWYDNHLYLPDSKSELFDLFAGALIAARSEEESRTKRKRTNDLWADRYKKIAEGSKTPMLGNYPAWIEIVDGEYALIDHRAKVLNEIFDLYIDGVGIHRIVQMLNDREEPVWQINGKNTEGGWYLAYVHRLLTKRTVMGEYVKLTGEIISPDHFPQAVSADKFFRAQQVRSTKLNAGGQGLKRANNLLTGLVRCSSCGGTAGYENKGANSTTKHKRKDGTVVEYKRKLYERFRCDRNRRKRSCDNAELFDYQVVERAVLDRVLDMTLDEGAENPLIRQLVEQIAETTRLIQLTSTKIENLMEQIEDGVKGLGPRLESRQEELAKHQAALTSLQQQRATEASKPSSFEDAKMVASLRSTLNVEDPEARFLARTRASTALQRVVDEILISPDGTFTVLADIAVWQFNKSGEVIGGQAL